MANGQDIRRILDPLQVPDEVKAQAWDAYHGARDAQDFQRQFDKIALPNETKAGLWDVRFGTPTGASRERNEAAIQRAKQETERMFSPLGKAKLGTAGAVLGAAESFGVPQRGLADVPELGRRFVDWAGVDLLNPPALGARAVGRMAKGIYEAGKEQWQRAKTEPVPAYAKIKGALAFAPILGPALGRGWEEIQHGLETEDPGLVGMGGGRIAGTGMQAAMMTPRGAAAADTAISKVGGLGERAITAPVRATGRVLEARGLRVPPAPRALRQAIQPGVNIPRAGESIDIAGPRLQQLRQSGALATEAGEPLTEFKSPADLLQGIKGAKQAIYDAVEQRLGPVAQLQADASSVANAMERTIAGRTERMFPQVAAKVREMASSYRRNLPLREIENSIQEANNQLRDFYKRPIATYSPISAATAATEAEVRALRSLLDEKVEQLSGSGVADFKREYGALRDVERAAARANAVATRTKGATLWEGLAALRAAGDFVSGNVLGAARGTATLAVGRWLDKLRNPNYLIEQAFQGKRAFPAGAEIPPPPPRVQPHGFLPVPPPRLGGPGAGESFVRGIPAEYAVREPSGLLGPGPKITPQLGYSTGQEPTLRVLEAERTVGRGAGGLFKRVYTSAGRK